MPLAVFLVAGGWHVDRSLAADLARYRPQPPVESLPVTEWWSSADDALPRQRSDLEGQASHPLTLQWAAPLADIRTSLERQGWQAVPPFTAASVLRWLVPNPHIDQLPVLPQVHDGEHGALVMTHPVSVEEQWVLRLWPAHVRLEPGAQPLWLGNIAVLRLDTALPLLTFTRTEPDFVTPVTRFHATLQGWRMQWFAGAGSGSPLLRLAPEIDPRG